MPPRTPETHGRFPHPSRRTFLLTGAAGARGLAAASGSRIAWAQDRSDGKRGGTLVVRSGPIRGIDPHIETWAATMQVVHQTYDGLSSSTTTAPRSSPTWPRAGSRRTI